MHAAVARPQQPDTAPIKVDRGVYNDIKTIASFRGTTASEWLTALVRPLVLAELQKVASELSQRLAQRQ